jgi:hypothetical protein
LGGHEFPFAAIYEQHGREIMRSIEHTFVESDPHASFLVEVAGKTIQVDVDHVEMPAQPGEPAKLVRRRVGKRKEKPTASTRELLYVMGYRQQYPGQHAELQEHNLSTSQRAVIKLTEKKEQSLYEELEKSIRGLERQEFPPKPDPFYCPTCPFFLICPA